MQQSKRKRFGDILVDCGLVTPAQLEEGLRYGEENNVKLGQSLKDLGIVDELTIAKTIARQLGFPYVDFDKITIDQTAVILIPELVARKHKLIALGKRPGEVLVAFSDPLNIFAVDEVSKIIKGRMVLCVAVESRIEEMIDKYYLSITQPASAIDEPDEDAPPDSEVVEIVNSILLQAVKREVSDIHIEPNGDMLRFRFRIDGMLRVAKKYPIAMLPAIISRIKIMSMLDIGERRNPQDGRFELPILGHSFDVRVSTLPLNRGEKIVMRLLDKARVNVNLKDLGFEKKQQELFEKHLFNPHEIILVTGPTGSGKTTTLYGALNLINSIDKNIVTVEDPVEYELIGVNQVQTNAKAGLSFASALRSILRQDPDVVMIGEIRDEETAEIAIQAALTGHLVLSTLHTNNASGAISRLVEMGIPPFLITSAVGLILAQRLIRRLCPECRREIKHAANILEDLGLAPDHPVTLYGPGKCSKCEHLGYKGRIAIYEVLTISSKLEDMIMDRVSTGEITRQAQAEGLVTLHQSAVKAMLAGITSPEEIYRLSIEDKD
ncbi:MAG TPA: type II secretion system protein GspE [Desulfobacterales bacterium]|nr:type II secretion system protein GspE [Desulfobacterales bacterium]